MTSSIPGQTPLHEAAEDYYNRYRWTCMPLQNDSNGLPKRPIVTDWTNIKPYMPDIDALPWAGAAGLGILLGPASSNLAVIDIDSKTLARAVYAVIKTHKQQVYAVRTARGNMHLYITEAYPSASSKFQIGWEGAELYIEFKARGTQVAAPPSPGYKTISDDLLEWRDLATFWNLLDGRLSYLHPDKYSSSPTGKDGAQPKSGVSPWLAEVKSKTRNDTLYIEAHRLREAGMPYEEALSLLMTRIQQSYENNHDLPTEEIRATIASAYRKGVVTKVGDTAGPREFNPL
jgi:hypothetical protein